MTAKETFKPGDKVRVPICERNSDFCTVSLFVTKREDENVPLRGNACGCVRSPEKIVFLALKNQLHLSSQG
ncbi:MAG: hypothetical protein MUP45_01560 [Candidatus Marinimicrobia bacterium]|nr:hypothetical protein [Candidatus Neomarinimicrobiota bacterium]